MPQPLIFHNSPYLSRCCRKIDEKIVILSGRPLRLFTSASSSPLMMVHHIYPFLPPPPHHHIDEKIVVMSVAGAAIETLDKGVVGLCSCYFVFVVNIYPHDDDDDDDDEDDDDEEEEEEGANDHDDAGMDFLPPELLGQQSLSSSLRDIAMHWKFGSKCHHHHHHYHHIVILINIVTCQCNENI